ncbi:TRPM3-like protein [Mya arenaria]|uniref:TRPM3-like protein n=1 Tax=Mya arenaria TaxID=6604 RepID=A0ABY7EE28_MYAAR|nr:TRPM3-like protein [Mya arenaria]
MTRNADCTNNKSQWMNGSLPRCPTEKSTYVVPVMLGVYMLMVHVLLLNLLIAIFSKTYTKVHLKAYQHWYKLRYELILEYSERPSLCPPLIVFCHVWQNFFDSFVKGNLFALEKILLFVVHFQKTTRRFWINGKNEWFLK